MDTNETEYATNTIFWNEAFKENKIMQLREHTGNKDVGAELSIYDINTTFSTI